MDDLEGIKAEWQVAAQLGRFDCSPNVARDVLRLVAEVERLRTGYSAEIAEYNAGYDHAKSGGRIEDEPSGLRFDVWRLGYAVANYEAMSAEVRRLREAANQPCRCSSCVEVVPQQNVKLKQLEAERDMWRDRALADSAVSGELERMNEDATGEIVRLRSDVAAIAGQAERNRMTANQWAAERDNAEAEVERLTAENARLRAALEQYANPDAPCWQDSITDGWLIAQAALAQGGEG